MRIKGLKHALLATVFSANLIAASCMEAKADPFTATQTGAAVVGVGISAINSAGTARWQKETSAKLDTLIARTDTIIAELRDLRVFIPTALAEQFRSELAFKARSLSDVFGQYMASPTPDAEAVRAMRKDVVELAYNLAQRGPSVYQAAAAVTILGLAVFKAGGGISPQEQRFFLDKMLGAMTAWAGDEPGMLGAALKAQQVTVQALTAQLAAIPRGTILLAQARSRVAGAGFRNGAVVTTPCVQNLTANVAIDDVNLTQSVTIDGVGGCSGGNFDPTFKEERRSEKARSIQGILDSLRAARARLAQLQGYHNDLTAIIAEIGKAREPG